uniref:Uncharacterized protein n=1 Tax=Solanum lycopersicum TaxID=4081 RepID=A0A3Q7HUS1_SOLLC
MGTLSSSFPPPNPFSDFVNFAADVKTSIYFFSIYFLHLGWFSFGCSLIEIYDMLEGVVK